MCDPPNVAIVAHDSLKRNALFDLTAARDNCLERFYLLQQELSSLGLFCQTADMFEPHEIDVLIFQNIHCELDVLLRTIKANPFVRLVYIAAEPWIISPMHDDNLLTKLPVDLVLTWNDHIVDCNLSVVKCTTGEPVITADHIPRISFKSKKFISCICSNKSSNLANSLYAERLKAIDFLSRQPEGIDLFGMRWETSNVMAVRSSFNGPCDRKKDVQQQYKFSIAYENVTGLSGYITEKIFDCFAAGTVPVYYGAPNITDYIPSSCFVDLRNFESYQQLYNFLVNMTESEYEKYLEAVKLFLSSSQYQSFTSRWYADVVSSQISALLCQSAVVRSPVKIKLQLLDLILKYPHILMNWRPFGRFALDLVSIW